MADEMARRHAPQCRRRMSRMTRPRASRASTTPRTSVSSRGQEQERGRDLGVERCRGCQRCSVHGSEAAGHDHLVARRRGARRPTHRATPQVGGGARRPRRPRRRSSPRSGCVAPRRPWMPRAMKRSSSPCRADWSGTPHRTVLVDPSASLTAAMSSRSSWETTPATRTSYVTLAMPTPFWGSRAEPRKSASASRHQSGVRCVVGRRSRRTTPGALHQSVRDRGRVGRYPPRGTPAGTFAPLPADSPHAALVPEEGRRGRAPKDRRVVGYGAHAAEAGRSRGQEVPTQPDAGACSTRLAAWSRSPPAAVGFGDGPAPQVARPSRRRRPATADRAQRAGRLRQERPGRRLGVARRHLGQRGAHQPHRGRRSTGRLLDRRPEDPGCQRFRHLGAHRRPVARGRRAGPGAGDRPEDPGARPARRVGHRL